MPHLISVFRFHISLPWVFKGPWLKPRDAKRGKLAQESCYPGLYTLHSALYTVHFTLYTSHSTLYAPHFTLCTTPTTVYTLHCPPPTVMILSPLVNRLLEAQTICSTFGIVILALQPFATPSSVSLLIPLQTLLFRTPTDAALLSFGVPPFSPCF